MGIQNHDRHKMEFFAKFFAKSSILDVWQSSDYAPGCNRKIVAFRSRAGTSMLN